MADFDYTLRASIPRVLIEAVPGEALSVTLPILDSAGAAVPIPSSAGWSALAKLRTQPASSTVLHTFTSSSNIAFTTGSTGAITLSATATETAAWQTEWTSAPQGAMADVFVTDNGGIPHCIADLVVTLLPRTTRS